MSERCLSRGRISLPERRVPKEPAGPSPLSILGATADVSLRRDVNPVLAYLARPSPDSRRAMRGAPENVARPASGGETGALEFPRWRLGGGPCARPRTTCTRPISRSRPGAP